MYSINSMNISLDKRVVRHSVLYTRIEAERLDTTTTLLWHWRR